MLREVLADAAHGGPSRSVTGPRTTRAGDDSPADRVPRRALPLERDDMDRAPARLNDGFLRRFGAEDAPGRPLAPI
ncbi:hypothetical protein LNW71_35865 [Streptomyces sp. RKAG290]|nr:hypothetical protein [Streptomyces sp. RKAG290]MCM2416501.1 hypothetical protein [Streptomyces sp. RKAG290]